jgi:hypothetical protein
MRSGEDRRRHRRLPLRLEVLFKRVGSSAADTRSGKTLNVSTGGMLVEINSHEHNYRTDDLLSIDMSVEPSGGTLEYGGELSNHARIARIRTAPGHGRKNPKTQIALQFCEPPKLKV